MTASPAPNCPRVSVVVPTFRRPELVRRACASAFNQTMTDLEVVVVIDGTDESAEAQTRRELETLDDPRLQILAPRQQLGNGEARNRGIEACRGRWIALLDDDDEWMADKLAVQLAEADEAEPATLITCRLEARLEEASDAAEPSTFVWPRRQPAPNEPLSEYLFCPRRPGTGDGMAQTSTWLAPAALFRRVRFDASCRRYVDLDWLLRAANEVEGFRLRFAGWPRPLSVWNIDAARSRVSTVDDGPAALDFLRKRKRLFTRRGYAGFALSLASAAAVGGGRRPSYFALLGEALRHGRPTVAGLLEHTLNFWAPRRLLHLAASAANRLDVAATRKRPATPAATPQP